MADKTDLSAGAAYTAGAGVSLTTNIAKCALPLALAMCTLLVLAPRTRQTQRWRWRCAHGGCWQNRHGQPCKMHSTTGAVAAITAAAGATCSITGAGAAITTGGSDSGCTGAADTARNTIVHCQRCWCCAHGWLWRHGHGRNHEVYSATGAGAACSAEAGATDSAGTVAMNSSTGAGAEYTPLAQVLSPPQELV